MKNLNLNGEWDLYFHIEDGDIPQTIEEVKINKWDRIKADVPGNVEMDLCKAGIEEDPFYSENLYNYRKYEFYQWWFERYFTIPDDFSGKRIDLILKGLDTFGTIWVNGRIVGKTDNMLIEHAFDITNALKKGEQNHIAIRISSSINMVRNKEYPVKIKGGGVHTDEMVWLRKPPHSFGWDIAPRLLSAGIWRDIEIKAKENSYLKEVYYATMWIREGKALLVVKYRFFTDVPIIDDFEINIKGVCKENTFQCEVKTDFVSGEAHIIIDNPLLWWTKGYGEQNLYHVSLELKHKGKVVERRSEYIGIRLVEISTKYLPVNENEFIIKINNVPILAKGTNWVPLDALHSRDKKRLAQVHEMLDDLGCNIVRCWGGEMYMKTMSFLTYVIKKEFWYGRILHLLVHSIHRMMSLQI